MKLKRIIVALLALAILCVSIPASATDIGYITCDRLFTNEYYTGYFPDQLTYKTGTECTVYVDNFTVNGESIDISELTFEWYKDSQIIDGEISNRLTFTLALSATYTCQVYKDGNPVYSTDFRMNADTISVTPESNYKTEADSDLGDTFFYVFDCVKDTDVSLGVDATSVIEDATLTYAWYAVDTSTGAQTDLSLSDNQITVTKNKGYEYYNCEISDSVYTKYVMFKLEPNNTLNEIITINGVTPKRFERGYMAVAKVGDQVTMQVKTTSTNGTVSYRWEKVELLFDETQGYYSKTTDLGSADSITVTKQSGDYGVYGYEQFECYIDDGNEVIDVGFVLFLLDPYQVTTETTIAENTPNVSLDNTVEDLANSVLQDNMEQLYNQETAKITLTAESQQQLDADEQSAVDGVISQDEKIGACLDINLYKDVADETVQVIETAKEIDLSVEIPEELINTDSKTERTYEIVRVHEGEAEVLDCEFDSESGTVSFATDKFSTYVLTYSDTVKTQSVNGGSNNSASENIDTSKTSPATGDNSSAMVCALICTAFVATVSKKVFS